MPGSARIVIEIDGKHHYSNSYGRADSGRYAAMVAADRELKLAGYEVFRFGAHELQKDKVNSVVKDFFDKLFERYNVIVPKKLSGL